MRTRVGKHKLKHTKPASQLFLFSNTLNGNIGSYFSGNIVIENNLRGYDYKSQKEAKQVVDFMNIYCESRAIKPYKFLTVVLNYNPTGLTLATLSGDYDYPIAIHDSSGYEELAILHKAYQILCDRLSSLEDYRSHTLSYASIAKNEPIKLPQRSIQALKSQIEKAEQSILKSMSSILAIFHKRFQPKYRR